VSETLNVLPGLIAGPAPWTVRGDGTIFDADNRAICVLGCPEDALQEQDLANGRALLAVHQLGAALRGLIAVRPSNWNDDEDAEQQAAWIAADTALAAAGLT
jgi:hypothetical protein